MVVLETTDPTLFPENLDSRTAKAAAALRRAVVRNLKDLRRVVMVCDQETAEIMCAAHAIAAQESGMDASALFPPASYVAPTRE